VIIDPIYVTGVELEDARSLLVTFPHCQQYRRAKWGGERCT